MKVPKTLQGHVTSQNLYLARTKTVFGYGTGIKGIYIIRNSVLNVMEEVETKNEGTGTRWG